MDGSESPIDSGSYVIKVWPLRVSRLSQKPEQTAVQDPGETNKGCIRSGTAARAMEAARGVASK